MGITTDPNTFTFAGTGSLHVEWGGATQLGAWLGERIAPRRALVVTDGGLFRAGVLQPLLDGLTSAGFATTVFTEVVADPPEAVVLACVEQARAAAVDLVIGCGGGSSLDVAKLAAVLIASPQPLAEMYGIGKVQGSRLPLIQVPTTAGTGSEATDIAILTTPTGDKRGVVARQLAADHTLLDAALTVGLPPVVTAATGIDAMVHAIEAYTSRLRRNPLSDLLAREALRLLDAHLLTACTNGSDRAARTAMLLGAHLAGQAFANAPVAAVHALAYPLGSRCHIPHGIANALMLGPVLRFNLAAAAPLYAELADVLLGPSSDAPRERALRFVAHLEQRMDASGAPRQLRTVAVDEALLPTLAREAMQQTRLLVNNPIALTEADALALYRAAY